MTEGDPVVERLMAQQGVGLVTACVMRAFIGRFDRFRTGKQLARFCAVTPRNASSGERVADAGLVRAGDPLLKTMVIQVAHRVRRHSPRWSSLGDRLAAEGKPTCVVIGAIANRWVRALHHEMIGESVMR
jgi:transposase